MNFDCFLYIFIAGMMKECRLSMCVFVCVCVCDLFVIQEGPVCTALIFSVPCFCWLPLSHFFIVFGAFTAAAPLSPFFVHQLVL